MYMRARKIEGIQILYVLPARARTLARARTHTHTHTHTFTQTPNFGFHALSPPIIGRLDSCFPAPVDPQHSDSETRTCEQFVQ